MEMQSWTVVYRDRWSGRKVTAAVFAENMTQATRVARENAEGCGCKNWRIESIERTNFDIPDED